MKKLLLTLLAVFLLSATAHADALKIDRVWTSGDYGYALVTYKNITSESFNSSVTIECTALDSRGNKININSRSFYAHEYGPIKPGFKGTLKIPVGLYGATMKSMECSCQQR